MKKNLNEMANTSNKWAVVAFDETNYWHEDIQRKAKKIEGVYLVNLQEPTHLCELSVSYPAIFLRNFVHNVEAWKEDEGELIEIEMDDSGGPYSYILGSTVPKFIKYYEEGEEEDILENESCNPSYC